MTSHCQRPVEDRQSTQVGAIGHGSLFVYRKWGILLTSLAVEEEGAELVGMTVQMDLPELGLTGEAILTDIRSAPAIEPLVDHLDTRQVVTATFHHSSGDVIDLVVGESRNGKAESRVATGTPANPDRLSAFRSPLSPGGEVGHSNHEPSESTETIGTTSNHPFWSVDRQEFVQAESLEIGERLQTLSGDVKVVQQKLLSLWPVCDRATQARPEVSVSFLGVPRHIRVTVTIESSRAPQFQMTTSTVSSKLTAPAECP